MLRYDLHSHSTRSDGLLSPLELVRRAAQRRVDVLALTDHDELAGLEEARDAARDVGIRLVDGAEVSVSWGPVTLHVLALGIDPSCTTLVDGLARVRRGRSDRARRIGESLAAAGIPGAYQGALKFVTGENLIARTHFARFLVESGCARETKDVFKRYLAPGKPGYVEHCWATLRDAIDWIHVAGGQAVLAHPGRYSLDREGMRKLLAEFRDLGGDAIEVLSSSHTAAQNDEFLRHARVFGFLASSGSDYHGPGESWIDLGAMPPFPAGTAPVWKDW